MSSARPAMTTSFGRHEGNDVMSGGDGDDEIDRL